MSHHETIERIRSVISRVFGLDRRFVQRQTDLTADLGADSLDKVEIAMKLEEEFDVNLPDADSSSMSTVDDAARLVEVEEESA